MTSLRKRKKRQQDGLRRMIAASERLGLYELEDQALAALQGLRDVQAGRIVSEQELDEALSRPIDLQLRVPDLADDDEQR